MTDNRTADRVDHSPRVLDAIDELMRKKDASDNRTTEPLCKLLEDRGIKWEEGDAAYEIECEVEQRLLDENRACGEALKKENGE